MNTQKTLEALQQTIERLEAQLSAPQNTTTNENGFLKFTDKEILKMPKEFRKTFKLCGYRVHARKRCTGRYNCSYEIRFYRYGYAISVSAPTQDAVKQRFIEKINEIAPQTASNLTFRVPTKFHDFALYWFENFHKRKVSEKQHKNNLSLYNRHIKSKLQQYSVSSVPPMLVQQIIDDCPGNGKTADDVHNLFNQIFNCAINHGVCRINPLNLFVHIPHEKESGVALSREEELALLNAYAGTEYQAIFAVYLYTGLRPNEYNKAFIDGDFIVAVNSKQKDKKVHYKKIPICSHLRKYLTNVTVFEKKNENLLRKKFNAVLPNHTLKDLRKTFNTRCTECGVADVARKLYMGHSLGKLDNTYTGKSDDYLLLEAQKLEQWYTLYPKNTPKNDE